LIYNYLQIILKMKKQFLPLILLAITVAAVSFTLKNNGSKPLVNADKITWYSWQQAVELNKTAPRKLLVDVYTDWCGWCKVMDKQTFPNDTIADYLNKNFYCVKLNAEMRDSIQFAGNTFIWMSPEQGGGRNGIHTLAYSLLDGQMSYPTIVYLSEKFERIVISPGYKKPEQLLPELRFTAEEIYKSKSWNDYMKDGK
jgi:thioredoxin-related protein